MCLLDVDDLIILILILTLILISNHSTRLYSYKTTCDVSVSVSVLIGKCSSMELVNRIDAEAHFATNAGKCLSLKCVI